MNTELIVDGAPMARPWSAAELESRLGPADRELQGGLTLKTYDQLGVVVVINADGTVKELQFQFGGLGEHDYTPQTVMTGPFVVEGVDLVGQKAKKVTKALPGWGWESAKLNAGGKTWRGDNGLLHVYMNEFDGGISFYAIGLN